ncbi:DUF7108 family protein [Haloferacaceae archaeon DSL9]
MAELPDDVVDELERLTRLARRATDPDETALYREARDELAAGHGFTTRIRDEDDTLVAYPDEWVEDGIVHVDRIDDTSRAAERPLTARGDEDDWEETEAHNASLVEAIADEHGAVHAANARAFADYMGNHYVARVDEANPAQVEAFLGDYYPRNAWPSAEEKSKIESSLERLFDVADVDEPPITAVRR